MSLDTIEKHIIYLAELSNIERIKNLSKYLKGLNLLYLLQEGY